jgi:hypothetical protein
MRGSSPLQSLAPTQRPDPARLFGSPQCLSLVGDQPVRDQPVGDWRVENEQVRNQHGGNQQVGNQHAGGISTVSKEWTPPPQRMGTRAITDAAGGLLIGVAQADGQQMGQEDGGDSGRLDAAQHPVAIQPSTSVAASQPVAGSQPLEACSGNQPAETGVTLCDNPALHCGPTTPSALRV